jgi:2-hydroxychromene-2-carboxylate isomerase
MIDVEFFFGLGSRYSYLAFTQLERIEKAHHCRFILHPLSSMELMELRGPSPFAGTPLSGQYEWAYRKADALAWANYYGAPFVEPRPLPKDHRLMARACVAAASQDALRPYCDAMFQAVFAENREIDLQTCTNIASEIGLDAAYFCDCLDSETVGRAVTDASRDAMRRGAFGVPTMFVQDRMFWGNDRLILLEHYIAKLEQV